MNKNTIDRYYLPPVKNWEDIDKNGNNSTVRKRMRAENKQAKKNLDRDARIEMSNAGVPRRNAAGNKLGLKKRREYAYNP